MKFAATVIAAVFLAAAGTLAQPNQYPQYTGYVSDFAGIVNPAAGYDIAHKIAVFKKETGIEIAVVTVKTTGEQRIEEYVQGLWEQWKIGKVGRDNGVIFLVAAGDHRARIQVGYGLEPYLTDGSAGEILRDAVRPFFRQKPPDFSGGISAGVNEIIAKLGSRTYAERVAEQKAEEERRKREQAEFDRKIGFFLACILFFISINIVVAVVWCYFTRKAALKNSIRVKSFRILQMADKAEKTKERAITALSELQSVDPSPTCGKLAEELKAFSSDVEEIQTAESYAGEPLPVFNRALRVIEEILQGGVLMAERVASLPGRIAERRKEIENWKNESLKALAELPAEMERLKTLLALPGLAPEARRQWQHARDKFETAKTLAGCQIVDWVAVCDLLREVWEFLGRFSDSAKPAARNWKRASGGGQTSEGCDLLDAALVSAAVATVFGDDLKPSVSSDDNEYSSVSGGNARGGSDEDKTSGDDSASFGGGSSGGGGASMDW